MEHVTTRNVILEKVPFSLRQMFPDNVILVDTSYFEDVLSLTIRGFILGEKRRRYKKIVYPRDWWQAFKEQFFPAWLLNKYPVQYKVITVDLQVIYPTIKPAISNEDYYLVMHVEDDETNFPYSDMDDYSNSNKGW